MINVLITSASRKVSLIKSFQKAIKQEGEGKVVAVDINPLSAALYHADKSYLIPKSSDNNFIPKLLELCKKEEIHLIIPTRDEELIIFAKNKDKFDNIGTKVMVSDPGVIKICNDKVKFIEFCKNNNIIIPETYFKDQIKKEILDFPLFLRERFGKGSKKAFIIKNKDELDCYLKQFEYPIVQKYCDWKEYTVDLFADFNGNIISVVPRERIHTVGGESFISRTYKNDKLIGDNIKLAEKLNLIGHNTIQCFFNKTKSKFIEINPRFGGGANLSFTAGANTPLYLIKLIKGEKLKNKIGEFKDSLVMLRFTEDIFIDKKTDNLVKRF